MLLGFYQDADVVDILNAKDAEIVSLDGLKDQYGGTWALNNPGEYNSWFSDYQALKGRYLQAKNSGLGSDAKYKSIVASLSPVPNTQTPDSLIGLRSRMTAFIQSQGQEPPPYTVPQPVATDYDLQAYKIADTAVKGVESAAKTGKGFLPWIAGGAVALLGLLGIIAVKR